MNKSGNLLCLVRKNKQGMDSTVHRVLLLIVVTVCLRVSV